MSKIEIFDPALRSSIGNIANDSDYLQYYKKLI